MRTQFPNGWLLAVLGVAMLLAGASWIKWHRASSPAITTEDRTILVSPFTTLVAEDRDLGVRLASQVEAALGASHRVTIRSWQSSAQTTTDAAALVIGRQRDASYVLLGQLEHLGTRIEVAVRLLHVPDGRPVWSGTYWRDPGGLTAFPSELAVDVLEVLRAQTAPGFSAPEASREKATP